MRLSSVFNRLTALSIAIGLIATALLYATATLVVRAHSDTVLAHLVDTDVAGLVDIYATGGEAELRKRIADRIDLAPKADQPVHYVLMDADGKQMAGDLSHWPALNAQHSDAGFVTLNDGRPVFGRATQLSPTLKLAVAREYADRTALLRQIALAFTLTGAGVVALIVGAGAWAARTLRRRVQTLNLMFERRETGGPGPVEVVAAGDDELDSLAAHVGAILARQANLVSALRNASDQTAHEIRTPLMHLDTRLQRIITQSGQGALSETLMLARQDIKTIIRMLESLLDIAASEGHRGDTSGLVMTNISELAIQMADLFADSAHDLGLALETAITPGVMMPCDAVQITRMLSNLLDNALKYVPSGCTVRVSVAAGPFISVIDNGPGVAPELRQRIFQRFQRGEDCAQSGHGLGLALVRAIAERHGLSVRCEDASPGAAFLISPREK